MSLVRKLLNRRIESSIPKWIFRTTWAHTTFVRLFHNGMGILKVDSFLVLYQVCWCKVSSMQSLLLHWHCFVFKILSEKCIQVMAWCIVIICFIFWNCYGLLNEIVHTEAFAKIGNCDAVTVNFGDVVVEATKRNRSHVSEFIANKVRTFCSFLFRPVIVLNFSIRTDIISFLMSIMCWELRAFNEASYNVLLKYFIDIILFSNSLFFL